MGSFGKRGILVVVIFVVIVQFESIFSQKSARRVFANKENRMICERDAREEVTMAWSRISFSGGKTKRSYLSGNFTSISGRSAEERHWRCRCGRIRYLWLISTISFFPPTRAPSAGVRNLIMVQLSRSILEDDDPWKQLDLSLCRSHFDILAKTGEVLRWKAIWFTLRYVTFKIS